MNRGSIAPFFGAHVLGTSCIRINDAEENDLYDRELPKSLITTSWTCETMSAHITSLLNLLPRKLNAFVLVNTGVFPCKIVQAAVAAVTQGTKVKVIPSLMARFMYISINIEPPIENGEHLLVLTKVNALTDFHVLLRKDFIYNFAHEFQGYPLNILNLFDKYAAKYLSNGGKAVILFDSQNTVIKDQVTEHCSKYNIVSILCLSWEEMLLGGGLNKAQTMVDETMKQKFDIRDFSTGFQLNINGEKNADKDVLIKVGSALPINLISERVLKNQVKIRSNPTTVYAKNLYKRLMNLHFASDKYAEGLYSIEITVETNGVEYVSIKPKSDDAGTEAKDGAIQCALKIDQVKNDVPTEAPSTSISPRKTLIPFSSGRPMPSKIDINQNAAPSKPVITVPPEVIMEQQSLILPAPADFMICINGRHCCVCLPSVGNTSTRITNINGNQWFPCYVSFLEMPPTIGEAAKDDMMINSEAVVYDIMELLTVPYTSIKINPEWDFNVAYTEKERTVLEIYTPHGYHAIEPVSVMSLLIVGCQKEAERVAGRELKKVFIKACGELEEYGRQAIEKAVILGKMEFAGVDFLPPLKTD